MLDEHLEVEEREISPYYRVYTRHNLRARRLGIKGRLHHRALVSFWWIYGRRCLACGSSQDLTIDHVIPLSRRGRNDLTNLQPLCGICNVGKDNSTTDYRKVYQKFLSRVFNLYYQYRKYRRMILNRFERELVRSGEKWL